MKDFNIKYNKERIKSEFFIDRNGKKIKFKGNLEEEVISMHSRIASHCFPDLDRPQDYVLKTLGWVMVGSTVFSCPVTYRKPSEKQIEVLKKLKLFHRLIFEYRGEDPGMKGFMPNYEKYGVLYPE